jgi:hypothetical protein
MTATVTALPLADARLPFHAPIVGAMPLPYVPAARELSGELGSVTPNAADPTEPLAETALGELLAAVSGAATGGVAAGTWAGAATGAALTVAGWSLFSLVGSWHAVGPKTKAALGVSTLVAGALTTALVVRRTPRKTVRG